MEKATKGHTYVQWIFALLANVTLLSYGMENGWISPTTKILQSEDSPTGYPISDNMISWIATIALFLKAPESPAFLVTQGKINEALETVAFLRGLQKDDKIVINIVSSMQKEQEHFKSLPNLSIIGIVKDKTLRRGFCIIMLSFVFHAFNGTVAIITYASTVLISTGVKFDISPEIQTLSFPIVIIISSLALAASVEKFGRKILLVGAYLISAFSMAAIAVMMIVQERGVTVPSWMPVITMMLGVAMYGAGISPLPYIILTETFSFQIRAKVVGVVVTLAWFMTFLLVTMYTPMCNAFGQYSPFVFYAAVNFGGFIFVMLFIPETKGRSEEEILSILARENKNPKMLNAT
ncbi:facilitated trehalose transporter Tret1-like [Bicyclus anynana]|uniref:Facilitated trehalose transporter Tret1-like n=1 Tax=Bicyclus anynana TaxID=110368 RepID=A0ABM3LQG8_BICAN|nr:facilitated trehalose transporter Tret1-like [Bicyclus anynana]